MAKPTKGKTTAPADATHVRIMASVEGFRRAGIAHPKAATLHPIERFTADQLDALAAEPKLTLDFVAPDAGAA